MPVKNSRFDKKHLDSVRTMLVRNKLAYMKDIKFTRKSLTDMRDGDGGVTGSFLVGSEGDLADAASKTAEEYLNMMRLQACAGAIQKIDDAIASLNEGTYGSCAICEQPIADNRLSAIPWVRTCIICANANS